MGIAWPKSGDIVFDNNGVVADGAIANFYTGGTTTPLTVYEDADEGTPHEADVEADANGRWPVVFIPFTTSYDVKVTTEGGTQLYYHREIPNPDPVEASEDSIDEEYLLPVGGVIWMPVAGTLSGFVRCNGRTIGNAASGATERANADTVDLFTFKYNNMSNTQAPVSGGRGASAAADYAANKTITLLDLRGGSLFGLDDMGGSAASRFTLATFTNGNATTAGSIVGSNSHVLVTAELPAHLHSVSITSAVGSAHSHTFSVTSAAGSAHSHTGTTDAGGTHQHFIANADTGAPGSALSSTNTLIITSTVGNDASYTLAGSATAAAIGLTSSTGSHTHTFTSATESAHTHGVSGTTATEGAHTHSVSGNTGNTGSGTAHNSVSYGALGTFFQKL